MDDVQKQQVLTYARYWQESCSVNAMVFCYQTQGFLEEAPCGFCQRCEMHRRKRCDYLVAHRYSSYEAERWNGLYIYNCPLSLAFVSTTVFENNRAIFAVISGPLVMGSPEEALAESGGVMADEVLKLPRRAPSSVNAMARVQWSMCMYLSGRAAGDSELLDHTQSDLHNTLYDISEKMRREAQEARYPFELEQRLRLMIVHGDKQGARELINQLLGAIYFSSDYRFTNIKSRAKELIILFSRASIEGGADVRRIFGQNGEFLADIDKCQTLDELSVLLTSIFHRFVGYVFDFSQFEHADIIYKAAAYMRENLAARVSLEDLAAYVGLSRGYLSALFKSELGTTFTDYVNSMRIEKSKELLLSDSLSLADIAGLVGYSDQSYFTKKFTQLTGSTPGQYRKKRGHINEV